MLTRMSPSFFLILFVISGGWTFVTKPKETADCAENCPIVSDDKINVHLVPHSHDDVGWLKTLDQYYFGSPGERKYENAGVQYIISSVVEALKNNPDRRFIQVETAFFWKWWNHQNDETRQDFVNLVKNGQLEIVNGAWSMNDEAATHYQSIIDQFTWGFRKLEETIETCAIPKIGWQIDPFGHSREHASIVKRLGFDGLILDRIDFRDKAQRNAKKTQDFSWTTSANLENSELFTSMFPEKYDSNSNFCWDVNTECSAESIIDDKNSPEYNLDETVKNFENLLTKYADYYSTNNIIYPMGGDFQYQSAERNFINLDRLIKGFENNEKFNVIYSTPSCYVKSVKNYIEKNELTLPTKSDDFFPYASKNHTFWTGYFTSRPTAKRFERISNKILQATKQIAAISKMMGEDFDEDQSLTPLREAVAVLQHHDAITGTAKQTVADDYNRMLSSSIDKAEEAISKTLQKILNKDGNPDDKPLEFKSCHLSNMTVCEITENEKFVVVVYNPLARVVSHYVRLPVDDAEYKITGPDGEEIHDILDPIATFDYLPEEFKRHPKELVFRARDISGLGSKLYLVEKQPKSLKKPEKPTIEADDGYFGSETNGFSINPDNNKLASVKINGVDLPITQDFFYHSGYNAEGEAGNQNAGAYIFRPDERDAKPVAEGPITAKINRGQLVDELIQTFEDNRISQIIRAYKEVDDQFIEFDWLVGDLQPLTGIKVGREILTRFSIGGDFKSGGVFYTDSNGREQLRRELNKRGDYEYDHTEEPVSSNFYPITAKIVSKDGGQNLEVAVLNDRAQGGTSLKENEIEIMVHRRLLADDGLGVNEPLDEQEFGKGLYARGSHFLVFGKGDSLVEGGKSTAAKERDLAHRILLAPVVMIANGASVTLEDLQNKLKFQYGYLKAPLPDNIHLLTFEPWTDGSILMRFEHVMEKQEDDTLSQKATFKITDHFDFGSDMMIAETKLGGTPVISDKLSASTSISLEPMEIRTFVVQSVSSNLLQKLYRSIF